MNEFRRGGENPDDGPEVTDADLERIAQGKAVDRGVFVRVMRDDELRNRMLQLRLADSLFVEEPRNSIIEDDLAKLTERTKPLPDSFGVKPEQSNAFFDGEGEAN